MEAECCPGNGTYEIGFEPQLGWVQLEQLFVVLNRLLEMVALMIDWRAVGHMHSTRKDILEPCDDHVLIGKRKVPVPRPNGGWKQCK